MSSVREKRAAEQKAANKREEEFRVAGKKIDKLVEEIEATPVPEQVAEENKPAKKKAKAKAKAKKVPKKAT